MWRLKTSTVPVIVGALGMINKGTDKHINETSSSPHLNEIQKTTLSEIVRLLW